MRGKYVLWFLVLAACGRWGFEGADAQIAIGDGDAGPTDGDDASDASQMIGVDAAGTIGPDYTVVIGTATYPALPGATTVPGFTTSADDESYAMTLPFPFPFYKTNYTTINISANGFVTFGLPPTAMDAYINDCPLDATTPTATIAVFWDDLFSNTATLPSASMTYAQDLAATDPWFAIEWRDFDAYFQAGGGNNHFEQNLRVT